MFVIETHPFGNFIPAKAEYLVLGSFIALKKDDDDTYDWFYGSKRSQFWPIIEAVYGVKLPDKKMRQGFFTELRIAVADIILKCERRDGNSSDANLINCVYNIPAIKRLLKRNNIGKIFFSSRFVERKFKKQFKDLIEEYPRIKLVTLPSPSPRYNVVKKTEKIRRYKELFPEWRLGPRW